MDISPALTNASGNELFCHKAQRDIIYSCSGFMKTITKRWQREGYFMTKRSNKRQQGWGIGLFLSLLMVFSVEAKKNELVIATTFSPDATA